MRRRVTSAEVQVTNATINYSAPHRPAARPPLSERLNLRLLVFLAIVAIPFIWVAWLIINPRMIVKEGDYYFVDLKAMGNFPFDSKRDTIDAVPREVRELDGKKVKFDGEMYAPSAATNDVRDFQLVYSIVECCLGGPPKVQERVFAYVPEGKRVANYTNRQVSVIGTLRVAVKKDGDETVSVFTMDVDEVTPKT
jgi:hypothetical protein